MKKLIMLISVGLMVVSTAVCLLGCESDNSSSLFEEEASYFGRIDYINNNINGIYFTDIDFDPNDMELDVVFYRGYGNIIQSESYSVDYKVNTDADVDRCSFSVPNFNGDFAIQPVLTDGSDVNQIIVFLNDAEIQTLDRIN